MDSLIPLIYTLLIYLPGNTNGYYIRLGMAGVLFFMVFGRSVSPEKQYLLKRVSIGMILSPIIASFPVMLLEQFNVDFFIKELIRMSYCVLSINIMVRIKVSDKILYLCALLALLPNFAIQMMEYLKVGNALSFVENYYVTSDENWKHLVSATYSGADFRSGSVFINPNVYMIIPLLCLCVFFYRDRKKTSLLNNIFIVIASISGLLTGSRTALVVMALIMGVYYYKYSGGMSRIFFVIALAFVVVRYGSSLMSNSRALQLSLDDSAGYKIQSILWYLRSSASIPLYWIFGGLGSNASSIMDNEIGRVIAWYGVYGLFWYSCYYKIMWNSNQMILFYSRLITLVIALVSVTASVMMCMPIFSFACLIGFTEILISDIDYFGEE